MSVWPLPRGTAEVYLMSWPAATFVKVGISANQRWRVFIPRGAVALAVVRGPSAAMSRLESLVHDGLEGVLEPAFPRKADAAPFLGCLGAGYLECYIDDGAVSLPALMDAANRVSPDHELVTA